MKNMIIPWPIQSKGDFISAIEFLERVGLNPVKLFILFISDHGNALWSIKYSEVERWVSQQLDNHYLHLTHLLCDDHSYKERSAIEELQIYYDNIHSMVTGDDVNYEDSLHSLVAILGNYYSSMSLPPLGLFQITGFKDLNDGYAIVTLDDFTGDLIHEFYKGGVQHRYTAPV